MKQLLTGDPSQTRDRVVKINAGVNVLVKGLSVVVGMLVMPAYVKFFSNSNILGIWLTLVSVLSWVFQFNLGVGNGLRNYLTVALAKDDPLAAHQVISTSYFIIAALSAILCAVSLFSSHFLNWNFILNISGSEVSNKGFTDLISILLLGLSIQLFLSLVNYLYLSLQKAAVPSILMLISNLALLLCLRQLRPSGTLGDMTTLGWCFILTINLPLLAGTGYVFMTDLRHCLPRLSFFNINLSKSILRLGSTFLFLQIMGLIIFNTNNYLISALVKPSAVVQYQVYFKLFGLISTTFVLATGPIWSAVTEAHTRGDHAWILTTQKRLLILFLVGVLGEVLLVSICNRVVQIWMGPKFPLASHSYIALVAASDLLLILTTINTSIANGLGKLKLQVILIGAGALMNVPMAILFNRIAPGTLAVLIANLVSLLPYCLAEIFSTRRYIHVQMAKVAPTPGNVTLLPPLQGA